MPVVVAMMVDALVPIGLAILASTMTQEDIIHLRGVYKVPKILGLLPPTVVIGLSLVLRGESSYMRAFFMLGSTFHSILLFLAS